MGNANYGPFETSQAVTLNVAYKVTIKASKTSVKAGAKVTVSGAVSPAAFVGTDNKVTIQRYMSGKWKTFKSGVKLTNGAYSYKFTVKKGTYKLRTSKPVGTKNLAGMSGSVTIKGK